MQIVKTKLKCSLKPCLQGFNNCDKMDGWIITVDVMRRQVGRGILQIRDNMDKWVYKIVFNISYLTSA